MIASRPKLRCYGTRTALVPIATLLILCHPVAALCRPAEKTAPSARVQLPSSSDGREVIELDSSERDRMLEGMRLYLQSIQGILEALASNKRETVASYAHEAGTQMLQDAPLTIPFKAPLEFTTLSLDTHQKFDALAESAQSASRSEVLTAVADIMTGCTGCHSAYRIVGPN